MTTITRTKSATVNCDASFCSRTRAAGWAVWIAIDGGTKIKQSGTFKKRPKNSTEAEFWAMCNGAWLAASAGVTHILVQGDCTSALKRIDNRNGEFLKALQGRAISVSTKWVKAHTNKLGAARFWVNDWCDREAKKRMQKQRRSS